MRAPEAVFRVWRNRLRVELEAAAIFARLGDDLSALYGPHDEIAALARRAAEDEYRHADFCRRIVGADGPTEEPVQPIHLGPANLSLEDRVLYACVAVGCVTESLSTALLVHMYQKAAPGLVKETIHSILEDEVTHSRIGWAELARASRMRNLGWLSRHVPQMIRSAMVSEAGPVLKADEGELDLSEWGVLPPARSNELIIEAIETVVLPGLRKFRIEV